MKNISCSNSIAVFRNEVREKEKTMNQAMLDAFRNCRREQAKEYFELALKYNELYEISEHAEEPATQKRNVTFLLDYWFLQDLIRHLTPRDDEVVVYVTGNDFDNLRMPYRICPIALEKQSVVYARGKARSCADVLIELYEKITKCNWWRIPIREAALRQPVHQALILIILQRFSQRDLMPSG